MSSQEMALPVTDVDKQTVKGSNHNLQNQTAEESATATPESELSAPATTDVSSDTSQTATPEETFIPNEESATSFDAQIKTVPKANTEESRKTRSRSESLGRRTLRCTHHGCGFSTSNGQEFVQHQNTAHNEGRDKEELAQESPVRRFSARQKRAASTSGVDVGKNKNSTKKTPQVAKIKKASAINSSGGESIQKLSIIISGIQVKKLGSTNTKSSSAIISVLNKDPIKSKQNLTPETIKIKGEVAAQEESKESQKDSLPSASLLYSTASMISTNNSAASDFNMSGASEDEQDMSEEGGRLVIDDSSIAGNSSVVMPTRCGNIQNRTYICDECNYSTTSAQLSLQHKKTEHGHDFIIYKCDLCDYATKYKQKLPRHYKLHFSGSEISMDTSQGSDRSMTPPPTTTVSVPTMSAATTSSSVGSFTGSATPTASHQGIKRPAMDALVPSMSILPAEVLVEDGDDEDCDDIETNGSGTPPPDNTECEDAQVAASVAPPAKKKRKDVSPDKYFEVAEEVASTKFGCANCGNVYKWKKSLNKHWKEKHGNDPGDNKYTPPGMEILLQQRNHTQTEHRRCCHNTLLERITVKQAVSSEASSRSLTPQNFLNGHYSNASQHEDEIEGSASVNYMASSIPMGPFVLGTSSQPVFPSSSQRQNMINSLSAPIRSSSVLNLSTHNNMDEPDSVDEASKPLDFSIQRTIQQSPSTSSPGVKSIFNIHETTTEEDEEVSALNQLTREGNRGKDILKCPKCGEVLKTQTAYSNHVAMHLQSSNKRVAKCGVCQMHFPNNDTLNVHFMENHMDLIASHKEAIQKIPHGLQQTYHLLKMPLQNIPKLSSQEAEDPLKCNMCDFTAKWPAELQKHAVSHSDERPFVCMVCGSTYKWKWDLVKHFEKAHSNLPNPYKRRDPGSSSQPANAELQVSTSASHNQDDYEMEEGEISPPDVKPVHFNGKIDPANSFLFEQAASSQDDSSVENILRTSQQASLMMSRQPNFLDGPDDPNPSSSSSSTHDAQGERLQIYDAQSLKGLNQQASSNLVLPHGENQSSDGGNGSRPVRQALARNIRGRQNGSSLIFHSQVMRSKNKAVKSSYKGYKTVEGSESSDLKYQCVLCDYKARWPSEIMQHMKNHSSEKPYGCPNCTYRSKWKWDVVKHLKRCGGGGIKDVIDYSSKALTRDAPPNVTVTPEGSVVQSQQGSSPSTSSTGDEPTMPTQKVTAVSGDGQATYLQTPFLVSMPSSGSTSSYSNQVLVNAHHLMYQRLQAGNDSSASLDAPAESPSPSPPLSSPQDHPSQPKSVVFNSLINEGQHHCLHCTFVANSLAELRRHQVLHSDEKPFMCEECSYSTKWKCDMKKHKEKYKHNGPMKYVRPNGDILEVDKNSSGKCPFCVFETYSKEALQSHIRKYHPGQAISGKLSSSERSKFRCKECPFYTNELGDWINHRRLHQQQKSSEEPRQSPTLSGTVELDEARLKHPRKAVKKYSCSKCNFICLKSNELLEHQKQAHGVHSCPFCTQRCDTKEDFLDHLINHREFNVKEWEHFFMDGSENEEDVNNNNPGAREVSKITVSVMDTGSTANTIDLTSANSSPSPLISHQADQSLPCEWCDARFANVVRLYQHVSSVHPNQVREQEVAEGISKSLFSPDSNKSTTFVRKERGTDQLAYVGEKSKFHFKKERRSPTPPTVNGKLLKILPNLVSTNMGLSLLNTPTLVAQLGQHHITQQLSASAKSSEMGLNLSTKKMVLERLYQCTKCSFKTINTKSYEDHVLKHAAESQLSLSSLRGRQHSVHHQAHTHKSETVNRDELCCWFCGDLHESFLGLYQHMQKSHTKELDERQEQKAGLLQKIMKGMVTSTGVLQRPRTHASRAASVPVQQLNSSQSQIMMTAEKPHSDWLHERKVLTYKGTPLHMVRSNNELWYKCHSCNFMDRNPAQVRRHTLHVRHEPPRKYQCGHCSISYAKCQETLQHQLKVHGDLQPDVIVTSFEEITLPIQKLQDFEPLAFSCKLCSFKCQSKPELDLHSNLHIDLISYHCDHCPFVTKTQTEILDHVQGHDATKFLNSKGFTVVHVPTRTFKNSSSPAHVLQNAVKHEPLPFSPLQASTPVLDPCEPTPLDLSTDDHSNDKDQKGRAGSPAQNKKQLTNSQDKMDVDDDEFASAEQSSNMKPSPARQEDVCSVEEQEILEAEAANDSNKKITEAATSSENQTRVYKCKHCPFSCATNFEFRTHCSFHGLKGKFKCDYCSYSHQDWDTLIQHRDLHNHEPDFSPNYSLPPSPEEQDEEKASVNASSTPAPEILRCPDCPYQTNVHKSFNIHIGMHGQNQPFICDFCDWSADQQHMVTQHRKVHAEEPDYKTSSKDSMFVNHEYPKDHVPGEFVAKVQNLKSAEKLNKSADPSIQQPPYKLSVTKKLYTCRHCPYITGSPTAYDFHLTLHGGSGCFMCEQCSYRTQRWSLLLQHSRLHEEQDVHLPPSTSHSDKVDRDEHDSDSPIAAQPADKPDKDAVEEASPTTSADTPQSDGAGHSPSSTSEYSNVTSGEDPSPIDSELRCQRCPFCTSSKLHLQSHIKHHSGKGDFSCLCCDYVCISENSLLKHIKLHFPSIDADTLTQMLHKQKKSVSPLETVEKSSQDSSDKGELNKTSGEQKTRVYACRYCDREFENKHLMIQHEQQHKG